MDDHETQPAVAGVARDPAPAAADGGRATGSPCGAEPEFLSTERAAASLVRMRLILPVLVALHWATASVFAVVRVAPAGADGTSLEAWRTGLRLANAAMGGVAALLALLAWVASRRERAELPQWSHALPLATALAYMLFAAWITGIDQQTAPSLTPFMVAAFGVALFVRLSAAESAAVYGSAWLALWAALQIFQLDETLRLSEVVNATTLAALGWGLSITLDRGFARELASRRIIEAQRSDLERANQRLGESLAALRLANAELVQEVRVRAAAESELARLATNDPLTNVANRRRFFEAAAIEMERALDAGGRIAVAMIDVDHFKAINDRHGHAVGDEVLRAVAARTSASMRAGDTVGRLGGDEFALLLAGATLAEAIGVAERVAAAVAGVEIPSRGGAVCPTVSIGVAEVPPGEAGALGAALAAADAALYEAKRRGRGRVEVHTAPPHRHASFAARREM